MWSVGDIPQLSVLYLIGRAGQEVLQRAVVRALKRVLVVSRVQRVAVDRAMH